MSVFLIRSHFAIQSIIFHFSGTATNSVLYIAYADHNFKMLPFQEIVALFLCLAFVNCASKQPHIVFILADDYGYHDIGYHGTVIKTPVLDSLAANGAKLENYYVQPICSPTRSQLMTGRYQIHTGLQHFVIVADQANSVPLSDVFLPEKLKEVNYSTHLVGKWHLGFYRKECLPQNRGFDTAFGYLSGMGDYWTHHRSGPMPLFPPAEHWLGLDFMDMDRPAWEYVGNYSAFVFRDRANQIIQGHDKSKPLFLYLALQSVHNPLQVPEQYIKPYNFIKDTDRRTHAGMIACMDESHSEMLSIN
ncbi:putative arylsulfatase B isoform X2 [Apostichopus japonicus]|uniref:Putative arylsulfatase B isoform X2 n=1 Tax=Stichopus japonicus TaxID=307972 RepID=A0A2G8LF61_STIJA|nr:putative arylsulfatase B isoform X2 [Apostichopus japonicus]